MLRRLGLVVVVLLLAQSSFSVPLAPEIVEMLRQSGQFDQFVQANMAARERGVWEANPDPVRFGVTADIDTLHCIIVLVDFSDMPYFIGGFAAEPEDFDSLLFSSELFEPGSMTDYYFENSYGQALLIGEVTQWYRMPQTSTYYADGQRGFGSYPRNAQRLAEDAVLAADPDVDFSLYDNNNDGMVDGLFVVHAGPGYENTGNLNHIHSHAWVTSYQVQMDDGVYVWRYSMEPEESGGADMVHIGVFCHEFGHVLGLPDLYDYGYDSDGTGMWSLMSGGSWGGGGARPVHFDAYSKVQLGYVNPETPMENLDNVQLDAVEYNPVVYRLFGMGDPFPQYFLVENRQRMGFDFSLPGEGLLIFHVDETQDNNNNQNRYMVAVEQADGDFDLEYNRGSDQGDPWPGSSNNRSFDGWSVPNSDFYVYGPSEIAVTNISDSDSSMFADLHIMFNEPLYELLGLSIDDSSGGNDNGLPEAGETCDVLFEARNIRSDASDLVVTALCSDPSIIFTDAVSTFGDLPVNVPFDNSADPITFIVPDDYPLAFVTLTLDFVANEGDYEQQFDSRLVIGIPDVMLVDDDNGDDLETYYMEALDELEMVYSYWDIASQDSPAAMMNQYPFVIWFTGDTREEVMPGEDVTTIIDYLAGGGHLLLTSQDIVQKLYQRGDPNDELLLETYLKVFYDDREMNHFLYGEDGTHFAGLSYVTGGNEGANNQISQDALFILEGGLQLLTFNPGTVAGVGVLGDNYTVLTLGFGIEGVNNDFSGYDTRASLIEAAYQFLFSTVAVDDEVISLPQVTRLNQNYPNPFNARTSISFALANQTQVSLEIYDILGRRIETLVNKELPAGSHQVIWNAGDVSSGIYFYKLQAGDIEETRRMLLLK